MDLITVEVHWYDFSLHKFIDSSRFSKGKRLSHTYLNRFYVLNIHISVRKHEKYLLRKITLREKLIKNNPVSHNQLFFFFFFCHLCIFAQQLLWKYTLFSLLLGKGAWPLNQYSFCQKANDLYPDVLSETWLFLLWPSHLYTSMLQHPKQEASCLL